MEYKYNLEALYKSIPRSVSVESILRKLASHGISETTFRRHRKIKLQSASSISSDDLQVYAAVFDCTIDHLINKKVQIKPLVRRGSIAQRLNMLK